MPRRGASNEYHNIFFCEQVRKYQYFLVEKAPYLELSSTFNIKTAELIRPLLALRKHAYSNILKILQPKKKNFQIKMSDIFHISAQNIDCGYSLEPRQLVNPYFTL